MSSELNTFNQDVNDEFDVSRAMEIVAGRRIIKEKLIRLGAEKLAALFLEFCEDSMYTRSQIGIILAILSPNPGKMTELIKQEIENIKNDTDNLDKTESRALGQHLFSLSARILDLKEKSLLKAIECSHALLELGDSLINRTWKNQWDVHCPLICACEQLCTLYEESNLPIDSIARAVFDLYQHDSDNLYNSVMPEFKNLLGKEGTALLEQLFEESGKR